LVRAPTKNILIEVLGARDVLDGGAAQDVLQ
jgi:hypothetical protein